MTTPCRILVPIDFSPGSDSALDYAWFLARRVGATVDVLHVRDPHVETEGGDEDRSFVGDSFRVIAMQRTLAEQQQRGGVVVRGRVENGDPWETIVRIVTGESFDLVVMGHGRSSEAPSTPASIAHRVAHAVRCPVLKLRAADEREGEDLKERRSFHRMVFSAA